MARAKTVTTAGVLVFINGTLYGRVASARFSSSTPRNVIYGLDSTEPFEIASSTTKVNGQLEIYRTIGDGGIEGAGMVASFKDLPREKYFSIQIIERGSETVIFEAPYCSIINQSWSMASKGMVVGTIEFEALDWVNELNI
jgi:hypothetical protein